MKKPETLERRLLVGYLTRRQCELEYVTDAAPVFSKRYNAACDELEEVEELLDGLGAHD